MTKINFHKSLQTALSILLTLAIAACGQAEGDSTLSSTQGNSTIGLINVDFDINADDETTEVTEPESSFFYFSYDDSASTATYDLTMYALENHFPVHSSWGRAYEFLNAEIFSHFNEQEAGPFTASIGVYQHDVDTLGHTYHFGVNLTGPTTTNEDRKNVVLTLLVDISGSMGASYASQVTDYNGMQSLLQVTKAGLAELEGSLKEGDVVNLLTFSSDANTVLEDWTHDEDINTLLNHFSSLETSGSTDLNAGIEHAYDVATTYFDPTKANRVVILTDAYANTGVIDTEFIAEKTLINELEGIHLSGIGIGDDFQEAFLNEITEAGKGSYFSMITPQDAQRIFTDGFPSLIDVAVEDVKFKLTYPNSLSHIASAAEELSQNEEEVQSTNFSFNTSQFFIESFQSDEILASSDTFTLAITYRDQDTKQLIDTALSFSVEDLINQGHPQIIEALLVSGLANIIAEKVTCESIEPYIGLVSDYSTDKTEEYSAKIASYCASVDIGT